MANDFATQFSLYSTTGRRKYLNEAERRRVLVVVDALQRDRALFALTLLWTGARVTEVLRLTPNAFQLERATIAVSTLKRRRPAFRELPLPPALVSELADHFDLHTAQTDTARRAVRLWHFHRVTAWRVIKAVMRRADVSGPPASPRGLRHGFGVGTLQAGVPLPLVQRWLGHARMTTTAIYADVQGPEERQFAERFWLGAADGH